jgi:hypothetical protein
MLRKNDRFVLGCIAFIALECIVAAVMFMWNSYEWRNYEQGFAIRFFTSWAFDLVALACIGVITQEISNDRIQNL